jgi:hypothetical protein
VAKVMGDTLEVLMRTYAHALPDYDGVALQAANAMVPQTFVRAVCAIRKWC